MHSGLPVIKTKRLILREICEKDIDDMFEYAKLSYVGPDAGWEPHSNRSHTREVIKMFNKKKLYGQLGVYAVILQETNKMIGTCELHTYVAGFKAELGYTINPQYWGNGYAVEASKALLKWGFECLYLKRVECLFFERNKQSKRVCEKLGFKFEGIRRKGYQLYDGGIFDIESYALTDDDYRRIGLLRLWEEK